MCTNLLFTFADYNNNDTNTVISARAFELQGTSTAPWLSTNIYKVPAGQPFTIGTAQESTRYGFVGIAPAPGQGSPNAASAPPLIFIDGLNSQGLSVGALWNPGTVYPPQAQDSQLPSVFYAEIVGWALGNCATITDVQAGLAGFSIWGPTYPAKDYLPLHFIFTDDTGTSLVVEFLGGAMQTYKSNVGEPTNGVLTNSPGYAWQTTNFQNYCNLSVIGKQATSLDPSVTTPVGNQLVGLPGDIMSSSRFVRAAVLTQGVAALQGTKWLPPLGATSGVQTVVNMAMQLVQTVMETPYGTVLQQTSPTEDPVVSDYTQWSVVRDHTNLAYYFTTAFNGIMRRIALSSLDLTSGTPASMPLLPASDAWYEDVSQDLAAISVQT
jgi:choloylglycine hydrolase